VLFPDFLAESTYKYFIMHSLDAFALVKAPRIKAETTATTGIGV
jgi:hypothetical protein